MSSAPDRDGYLIAECCRVAEHLGASSVTVYLPERGGTVLGAAVVAVRPLGIGSLERIPLDDEVYASALAYRSCRLQTAFSSDELGTHPEFAVFAPFPFSVASAPLCSKDGRIGVLAVYWPLPRHVPSEGQRRYMGERARDIGSVLDGLAARGASMKAPAVPTVVPVTVGEGPDSELLTHAGMTAPLLYHLQKLSVALNQATGIKEAVALVIQRVMPSLAARAVVLTMVDGGRLHVVGAAGASRPLTRSLNGRPLSEPSPETDAVVHGLQQRFDTPGALAERYPDLTGHEHEVWTVLPMTAGGRIIGTCSLGFGPGGSKAFSQPAILTALATLVGQTLDRAQLGDAQHLLARKLQQVLLPRTLPQMPGLRTTTRYVSGSRGVELGGDWYDLIRLPDGGIGAVVGDVQGHNVTAAVIMGQLRSVVRAYATEGHDPGTVLARANRLLVGLDTERFATCCLLWLYPDTGVAKIATAGHHAPVIRGPNGGHPLPTLDVGLPLGIEEEAYYRITQVVLEPGTLIALYTDGLAEGHDFGPDDAQNLLFGELAEDPQGELETLGDRLIESAGRMARSDDAALLLIRYESRGEDRQRSVRRLAIGRRDLQGVRRTRSFVREWLRTWELDSLAEELELLASEVVTNALVHGDSDVDVHVRRYPDRVRVEVRDSDPTPAVPVAAAARTSALSDPPAVEDEAEGGRGLVIVSAMASAWGNSPSGRGKTVWFEIPVPPPTQSTRTAEREPVDA